MTARRLGSVCTGYGGLDEAVMELNGAELAWVADNDPDVARLLAVRYPGVPNLGDITKVDWGAVEPVDVFVAGFPCQPVSAAGRRLGGADKRWLWEEVFNVVASVLPSLVVLENVLGLLSGKEEINEPSQFCVCGWPRGWRGMHTGESPAEKGAGKALLRGLPDYRDDSEGAADPGALVRPVRWMARDSSPGNGEMGGGTCMDGAGEECCAGPGGYLTSSGPEAGASASGAQGGGCQGNATGQSEAGESVDGSCEGSLRDDVQAVPGTECQGPGAEIPEDAAWVCTNCPACGWPVGDIPADSVFRYWMGAIQGDLAKIGYDAEWRTIPASAAGFCHERERVFLLAWPAAADAGGAVQ